MTNDLRKKVRDVLGSGASERVMEVVEEMVQRRIPEEVILRWVDILFWEGTGE